MAEEVTSLVLQVSTRGYEAAEKAGEKLQKSAAKQEAAAARAEKAAEKAARSAAKRAEDEERARRKSALANAKLADQEAEVAQKRADRIVAAFKRENEAAAKSAQAKEEAARRAAIAERRYALQEQQLAARENAGAKGSAISSPSKTDQAAAILPGGGGAVSQLAGLAGVGGAAAAGLSAVAVAAGAMGAALFSAQRSTDVLSAQLATATGSMASARAAFAEMAAFAETTPYSLEQAAGGFALLRNLGLDASTKSLRAYGDAAAAMGMQLSEAVDAVAAAAIRKEFDPLERLGISAKVNGEKVELTFRGVTQSVNKDAVSMQAAITKLMEEGFSGAMERRMDSLDGKVSNLGDAWQGLTRAINENTSTASAMKSAVEGVTAVVSAMAAAFDETKTGMDAWGGVALTAVVSPLGAIYLAAKKVVEGLTGVKRELNAVITSAGKAVQEAEDLAAEPFKVDLSGAKTEQDVDEATRRAAALRASKIRQKMAEVRAEADKAGDAAAENQRRRSVFGFGGEDESATKVLLEDEKKAKEAENKLRMDLLSLDQEASTIAEARKNELAREEIKAGKAEDEAYMASLGKKKSGGGKKKKAEESTDVMLARSLGEWRLQQMERETRATEAFYATATQGSKKRVDELQRELEAERDRLDSVRESLLTEEEALQESYERRRQIVMDATLITEEAKLAMVERLDEDHQRRMGKLQSQSAQRAASTWGDAFEGYGRLLGKQRGEQAGAAKAMFGISKGANIASATMSTYAAAAEALKAGPILGPVLAAGITALGLAQVGQIASTQYAGAYDSGGFIPPGKWGTVGERGPEMVRGPAEVIGREDTAAMRGGAGPVQVINVLDQTMVLGMLNSAQGAKVVLNVLRANRGELRQLARS